MSLTTFDFQDAPVRVMMRDEQPWFVAADVCRVLDITNSRDAVAELDEDERGVAAADILRSNVGSGDIKIPNRGMQIISESGLYALIFKSRKPEAKTFRKWVTSEVLPAIRQTGKYEVPSTGGLEDRVSLLQFVREACNGWSMERQIELGLTVRRYAKAMGVVFVVETLPNLGRVFTFPRCLLEEVRQQYARTATLVDGDAVELEKLLEACWLHDGDSSYEPEVVRGFAKTMKLFPSIFGVNTSLASERSAFGKLIARYDGRIFPSGFCVSFSRGRYQIRQTRGERTLIQSLPKQQHTAMACTSED